MSIHERFDVRDWNFWGTKLILAGFLLAVANSMNLPDMAATATQKSASAIGHGLHEMGIATGIIKESEGFSRDAYRDPVGVWTIGWGTTRMNGRLVQPNDRVTEAEARQLLEKDMSEAASVVAEEVKVPLSPVQKGALISFVYNVGPSAFRESTLLKVLNEGNYEAAADQMLRWKYGDGQVLAGLVTRRQKEREIFLKGVSK